MGGGARVPQFVLWPGLLQGQKFSVSENIAKGESERGFEDIPEPILCLYAIEWGY